MDKLLAPHTAEATAHNHITYVILIAFLFNPHISFFSQNSFTWHTDQPSVDESLIAGCASYRAFERYLSGNDLFLLPRTCAELESILSVFIIFINKSDNKCNAIFRRRYAYDGIHNAIASSRSPLQTGGYSRVSSNSGLYILFLTWENIGL